MKFIFLFFLPLLSFAFDDSNPEFSSLTEREQAAYDNPSLLGGEYQADIYAYSKLAAWEYIWLSKDIAADTAIGSISAVHFLTDTRMKIHAPLNELIEFRLKYFDERNHEFDSQHAILELIFWPWKKIGFSLYGEPSYTKRENDIGLALLYKPNPQHEIRLFNTYVDVARQKRNDRTDLFDADALPYSRGVVGRWWGNQDFLEYAIRYETPSKWRFPTEGYMYRHWRKLASVYLSRSMSSYWRLNTRLQVDRKFEARDSIGGAISANAYTTDRILGSIQTPLYKVLPNEWELIPTLQYAYRSWSTPASKLLYNDFLLGTLVKLPNWFFDYSLVAHRISGGGGLALPHDKNAVNQRLDIGYTFTFSEQAELSLKAGFDIDAFGTKDSWEGGSGFFRWSL